MRYKLTARSILHQLGIGKSYSGYDYILYAIELLLLDADLLTCITKVLYVEVARKYHTSSTCVERNIRKVIEVIWKNVDENNRLIMNIFGARHLSSKPSNKEFLEMLYEYVKSYDMLQTLCHTDKIICPISKESCIAYNEIIEKFINLK